MKIALIQPDSPYLSYPLAFPSLGLLYISAFLKKNGYKSDFYDLTGGIKMPDIKADIFAFSCQITQFKEVAKIKKDLKKTNPHSLFVIGGPFPTHSPQLCSDFDVVVRGEGETSILEIVKSFPNVKKCYQPNGFDKIDPNFFPDWKAIDINRYGYYLEGKRCINIMTKRGNCPYKCGFCAKQEFGKSPLRFRTVENVLSEALFLKENYNIKSIAIYDDDVLLNKKRDEEIFKGFKKLGMPYRCMTRTNLANEKDLEMLKHTGCAEVAIGVETADPLIKKIIKKNTTVEQDTEFVNLCKKIGLRVKTYFIIGLPGESCESVEKSRKWLEKNQPDNFDFSIFAPYPGSPIYNHKEEYDINWDEKKLREIWFSGEAQYGDCAVSTSHLDSNEILKLKGKIQKSLRRGIGGVTSYWGPKPD